MKLDKIVMEGYSCVRCGHAWVPRKYTQASDSLPKACPACKSPYWNTPRESDLYKEGEKRAR